MNLRAYKILMTFFFVYLKYFSGKTKPKVSISKKKKIFFHYVLKIIIRVIFLGNLINYTYLRKCVSFFFQRIKFLALVIINNFSIKTVIVYLYFDKKSNPYNFIITILRPMQYLNSSLERNFPSLKNTGIC